MFMQAKAGVDFSILCSKFQHSMATDPPKVRVERLGLWIWPAFATVVFRPSADPGRKPSSRCRGRRAVFEFLSRGAPIRGLTVRGILMERCHHGVREPSPLIYK
jgi:hypothetical protein